MRFSMTGGSVIVSRFYFPVIEFPHLLAARIHGNGVRHSEGRDQEKPVRESPGPLYSCTGISMYPQRRLIHKL